MATNNRPLKAYVRYDGSGRAVSSSLIWRKNKPKVGNWKEVQGYECCNPDVNPLSNLIVSSTFSQGFPQSGVINVSLVTLCEECPINYSSTLPLTSTVTDIISLVEYLNANYSQLGLFTYSLPNQISLQLSSEGSIGLIASTCTELCLNFSIGIP
jgi:hypothetical protein